MVTPFVYLFLIGTFVYSLKFISQWFGRNINGSDLKSDPFIDKSEAASYADITEGFLYSVCLSFPILGFFIINGYSHRILVHWPDIGYMSAFPIMGYVADRISKSGSQMKPWEKLKLKAAKSYVYFAIFSGFFLSFVLYNQIYIIC